MPPVVRKHGGCTTIRSTGERRASVAAGGGGGTGCLDVIYINAPEGCPHGDTAHTHKSDGLHTRHPLERTHTNTHTHTNKHIAHVSHTKVVRLLLDEHADLE